MTYDEAIDYIHGIPRFVRPLGNENLSRLLEIMGNPQNDLKYVHVAGTNGKGSVCAMVSEVLKRAGYRTGIFTSPFIEVFNERIRINDDMIADDELARYTEYVSDIMKKNDAQVSEFAFITAVAFKYFADKECDIVVLETGMGGRLDATNIIPCPEVAVLTSISLDHMQYLGNTIEEIAAEKCGIIKRGCTVVSAPNERVRDVIENAAAENDARLTICEKAQHGTGCFIYKTWHYFLNLRGIYQAENGAAAVETIFALRKRGFKISEKALAEGLEKAGWKARYEFVTPNIIIDGGHNIDGIRALKDSLLAENREITLVLAMMKDKSYEVCVHTLALAAKRIVVTELNTDRALKADELKRVVDASGVKCIAEPDIEQAIKKAVSLAGGGLVCICGSLYLAGEAERIVRDMVK